MSSKQSSHITVTYRDGDEEITRIYATNEAFSSKAQRFARFMTSPTGKDLLAKLVNAGCQLDRQDGPAEIVHLSDGSTVVIYYRDGKLHRKSGPAYVRRDDHGTAIEESYYRDGQCHRQDGPAVIKREADGSTFEEYDREGKLHREDGPAKIRHQADGTIWEQYYRDGKEHRADGPALLIRNAEGSTEDYYYRDGKLHREDGPAIIKRFADASSEERYCRSGKLHREDGPAFVRRHSNGVRKELYYRDGIERTKDEYYAEANLPLGTRVAPAKSGQDALDETVAFALHREGLAGQSAPSRPPAEKRLPQCRPV